MEYSTIFFRSRKIRPHTGGSGGIRKRGRGTDVLDIGVYNPGDDVRDISWKHTVRHDTLEKKVREEESNFPIVIVDLIGQDSAFTIDATPSVSTYRESLIGIIRLSAQKHHFPLKEIKKLNELKNIKNSQIFVLYHMSNIEELDFIKGASTENDIIPVEIVHPYELAPITDIIMEGYSIDKKKYMQALNEAEDKRRMFFSKLKIEGIRLTTDLNPIISINQFLKNRI